MNTKVFGNNHIGFEVTSIADAAKARELGFIIQSEDGFTYDYQQEFTNDEGEDEERDPTDTEIYQRIQDALSDGTNIFATLRLNNNRVVPNAATTLQSEFFVGQYVYTMHDNKIAKAKIKTIQIAIGYSGRDIKQHAKYLLTFPCHAVKVDEGELFATKQELLNKLAEGEE